MFELRAVPKPSFKRNKPTRKQRGSISPSVTLKLYERSKGMCERCYRSKGQERAHTLRRWRIKGKTTLEDLAHLCITCHDWADETAEGRKFLQQFRYRMYVNAQREHEYYE